MIRYLILYQSYLYSKELTTSKIQISITVSLVSKQDQTKQLLNLGKLPATKL
jgi:hypothetical protein